MACRPVCDRCGERVELFESETAAYGTIGDELYEKFVQIGCRHCVQFGWIKVAPEENDC